MAFSPKSFIPFIKQLRYRILPFISSLTFSSSSAIKIPSNEQEQENPNFPPQIIENQTDESKVLNELCDLLPIRYKKLTPNVYSPPPDFETQSENRVAVDGYLSLEDKLRGVFLQNLKGKTSVQNALKTAVVGVELNYDVVSRVLDGGNLGGESMVMFFNWAIEQPGFSVDMEAYHVILKALGRRKLFDFMVDKFQEMDGKGIRPNFETIMIVMDSFIRARLISRALEMFGKLEEFGVNCDTEAFNVLVRCLCKRSYVGTANSLLNSFKGKIVFNCVSYNVVIGGWAKLGSISEMEKCLKAMVDDGFCPDCETYSCLIEGLGRSGHVDDAVKVFRNMDSEECQPDTGVYNSVISIYVSNGDIDEGMKYYEEMCRNNCPPNLCTYTKLIIGLLKARKVADALELFDEMLGQGITPTTGTMTSFIEPLCSCGPPHAAMMIYKSAKKGGCKMSLKAYKLLLMRLAQFGKCGMVLKLWNDMQECGYSSDMEVYEHVINGLYNNGQLDMAVFVMEEALQEGFCPSRLMYSKLRNKLVAFNKTESAYKLFLKIKRARMEENARKYWRANGWHF